MAHTTDYEDLILEMRVKGRHELIHYAGAAHRDSMAALMCEEYIKTPEASEAELKQRALQRWK